MTKQKTPPAPVDIRAAVKVRADEIQAEDKTAPRQGKVFLSFSEMLAAPVASNWLLHGYLSTDTLAMLYGESTAMKSFVALDMGLCIAAGLEWHGVKVSHPGPVAYIAAEGGAGMRKRMRAWALEHSICTELPFATLPAPVELLDGQDLDALIAGLEDIQQRHGKLCLVIIDTLARSFGGGDENSSKDMSAYVAALDSLRVKFGCAVLVVHHSGLQEKSRARGSSVLRAALDWEMLLEKREDVRVLTVTKSKDHEPPRPMGFKPKSVGIGWRDEETGNEITSCVLELSDECPRGRGPRLTGPKRVALDALKVRHATSGRVHITDWRQEAYRLGVSQSEEQDAKKKAFKRAVAQLLDANLVGVSNDYYWPIEDRGGQGGQQRDKSPVSPGARGGQKGHTSLEVSPLSPSPTQPSRPGQGDKAWDEEGREDA